MWRSLGATCKKNSQPQGNPVLPGAAWPLVQHGFVDQSGPPGGRKTGLKTESCTDSSQKKTKNHSSALLSESMVSALRTCQFKIANSCKCPSGCHSTTSFWTLPACNHDILWAWQSDFQFNMKRSVNKLVAFFLYSRTRVPRVPRTLEIINMQNQQKLTRQIFTPSRQGLLGTHLLGLTNPKIRTWMKNVQGNQADLEAIADGGIWSFFHGVSRSSHIVPKTITLRYTQTLQTSWQVIRYCNLFWTFHINESLDHCHKATVPVCWSSQTSHPVKPCWVQGHNTWGQWSLTIPGSFQRTQVIKEKLGMTKTLVVTGQSNFEAAVGILPCVMTNSLAFLQRSKSSEPKLQQHLTGLSPAKSQEHMSDSHTTFRSFSRYRFI